MIKSFFTIWCVFVISVCFAQTKTYSVLQNELTKLHELKNAGLGMYAENLSTGAKVFDYNSQISMAPASVFKIIPTVIALELLGVNHKFKTELAYTGSISTDGQLNGDLYIIGYGDPCLGSRNFAGHYNSGGDLMQKWANEVKNAGIKKINGDIIADISYFGKININGKWLWEDVANHYGSPGSALNYMDNMYFIHFRTGNTDGSPTTITKIVPDDLGLEFDNKVISSSTTGDEAYIFYTRDAYKSEIRGTLPWKQSDFQIKGTFPDPELYLIKKFLKALQITGVSFSGKEKIIEERQAGVNPKVFHTTYSPELVKIVDYTNLRSQNLYAEMLARHIEKKTEKSYSDAVKDFWKSKKVDISGLYVDDACGLSRFNSLTAVQMCEMLKYMRNESPRGEQFFNSLPVAGTSGTLSRYCIGTKAQNRLHAKSGSMTRVRAYAGYMLNSKGEEIVFCFMANNYDCTGFRMRKIFEDLFIGIANAEE